MRDVNSCPACSSTDRELVCEFNGLALLAYLRGSPLCRYDYALCRTCGLVFATKRPNGNEVSWLYSRFDEFLGRTEEEQTGGRVSEITRDEREHLQRRLARGWLVTEEGQLSEDEWMADVFDERVRNSFHANLLGCLIPIEGKRILELRATTGFMLDLLKRCYRAAEVIAMPMSERQVLVVHELNPMTTALLDFETLEVPFEGTFDVILARHMLTHAIEPLRLWQVLREKLKPGGYAYLYMENDDRFLCERKRKNLFGEMKCFHFQSFDLPTFARVLRYQGLDPVFLRHPHSQHSEMLCLVRRDDAVRAQPMSRAEFESRLALYRRWRDHSVLSLDEDFQSLFAGELAAIGERALAAGDATRDKVTGRTIAKKRLRLMHEEGYTKLNAGVNAVKEVGR
jgi:SAM-dependent methyltransferase